MNYFLNRTSIPVRIGILCLLPIIALAIVGINRLQIEWQRSANAQFVSSVLDRAPLISRLVHELQKERGTSAGYIGSKGKVFADQIDGRRADTDLALKAFADGVPAPSGQLAVPAVMDPYSTAVSELKNLAEMRRSVRTFKVTVPQMAKYYTGVITALLKTIESMTIVIDDGQIMRPVLGYVSLLQAKERAGIERAMGAVGFGSGAFKQPVHRRFVRLEALQDNFFASMRQYSSEADLAFFDSTMKGAVTDDVVALRKLGQSAPFGADISGVSGKQWFAASTRRIDALWQVEDHFINQIRSIAHSASQSATTNFWLICAVLAALGLLTIVVCFYVARSIAMPIKRLAKDMRELAQNRTSIDIEAAGRADEIGDMGRAVQVFRENAIERSKLEDKAHRERDTERQRQSHMEQVVGQFRETALSALETVEGQSREMRLSAEKLSDFAKGALVEADSATGATNDASANIESVAAATEQLSASGEGDRRPNDARQRASRNHV